LLGAIAEALRVNIDCKSAISFQRRPVDPKFQVEWVAPTNHFSSQKTRLSGLSYGVKIVLSVVTIHAFDRRTDRQTEFSSLPRLHSMQRSQNETNHAVTTSTSVSAF